MIGTESQQNSRQLCTASVACQGASLESLAYYRFPLEPPTAMNNVDSFLFLEPRMIECHRAGVDARLALRIQDNATVD